MIPLLPEEMVRLLECSGRQCEGRSSQADGNCLGVAGELGMTMDRTSRRLTHGAEWVYRQRRYEREKRGKTRKRNVQASLLFILADNGERLARGPIVYRSGDHTLVLKWKSAIVRHLVGQWRWELIVNVERTSLNVRITSHIFG